MQTISIQMTNFTEILLDSSNALVKPASEVKDSWSRYNRTLVPTNNMTPVIRCKIEAMAARGNLIVVISKFIGRFSSTTNLLLYRQKLNRKQARLE